MPGLFDAYNKTVGKDNRSKLNAFQTESMVQYGQSYKEARNADGRQRSRGTVSMRREMIGGRHAISESVLQAYSTAGVDVPEELQADLDQLDTLAISANQIAEMDNRARIDMVRRGHQGFNPAYLDKLEGDILRRVSDSARNVITEKQQLDRILKRQQVTANRLNIAKGYRNEEIEQRIQQARNITKDMAASELREAYEGGGINGVSRAMLLNIYLERAKKEQEATAAMISLNPQNSGFFGLSTGTGATGRSSANSVAQANNRIRQIADRLDPDVLNELLQDASEQAATDEGTGVTMVPIPGFGDPVLYQELIQAATIQQERENEFGQAKAASARVQSSKLHTRFNALLASQIESMNNVGMRVSPDSVPMRRVAQHRENYENAVAALDWGEAGNQLDKMEALFADMIKGYANNQPANSRPMMQEIVDNGKPVSNIATSDYILDMAGTNGLHMVENVPAYRETFDIVNRIIAQVQRGQVTDEEGEASNVDVRALLAGTADANGDRQRMRDLLVQNLSSEAMQLVFQQELSESILANVMHRVIQTPIANLETRVSNSNSIDPPQAEDMSRQLEALRSVQRSLFGQDPGSTEFESNSVGLLRTQPAVFPDGKGGQLQLVDEDGQPVQRTLINHRVLAQTIDAGQKLLEEAGVNVNLRQSIREGFDLSRDAVVAKHMPDNPLKMALMYGISANYRLDITADGRSTMNAIYDVTSRNIQKAFRLSSQDVLSVTNALDAVTHSASPEDRAGYIEARTQEILANQQIHYNPMLSPMAAGQTKVDYETARRQALIEFNDSSTINPESARQSQSLGQAFDDALFGRSR